MYRGYEPWEKITHTHHVHNAGTYHYSVAACKFVNAGQVGLALVVRAPLLVAVVEYVEVVVINVVPSKNICDEFQERGLSDSGLSKKKDGVRRIRLVFCCLDDSLFERHYVAKEVVSTIASKVSL